jgi:outer membrane lipoprotein-sorting protein
MSKQKQMHRSRLGRATVLGLAILGLLGIGLVARGGAEETDSDLDATEIMRRAHLNYYYAGDDGSAEVHMTLVDRRGKERVRDFTMLRLDLEDGGEQRYYTYFHRPNDVQRTTFMVWKHVDGDDDRWIYIPAIDLVKRIAARDKAQSFVGSDFSYEDVSGRHWADDEHTITGEETLDGQATWVIESRPKSDDEEGFKRTWVTQDGLLPIKEEQYDDKGELEKVLTADRVEEIEGIVTVVERTMRNVQKNHHTKIVFESIDYNVGLEENLFTERYLKAPPRQYIGS